MTSFEQDCDCGLSSILEKNFSKLEKTKQRKTKNVGEELKIYFCGYDDSVIGKMSFPQIKCHFVK